MGIKHILDVILFITELMVLYFIVSLLFKMIRRFFNGGDKLCEKIREEQLIEQRRFNNIKENAQIDDVQHDYQKTYQNEGFLYGLFFGHPILGMLFGSMFKKEK